MDTLPTYVPINDREKEAVNGPDSDDETTSDCEAGLIGPKQDEDRTNRRERLNQITQKILLALRTGMKCLLPSFLLPSSHEPGRLYPTAWLGNYYLIDCRRCP